MKDEKNGIVFTVLQEKGGCGKSTAVFNISYYLSRKSKVLIIDLDGQASDITYFLFGNQIGDSKDIMRRTDVKTIIDLFMGRATIDEVIIPVYENIDAIPANVEVTNLSSVYKASDFKKIISELKKAYDYILIDVPPSPNWAQYLCLSVCQYVIPIVNPDATSPKALIAIHDSVCEIQADSNKNIEYLGIMMNKYDGRTNIAKEMLSQTSSIASQIGTSLFKTMIHQSVTICEHILYHKSVFDYAPKSKAAKEYESLSKEILDRILEKEKIKTNDNNN